MLFKLLTIDLKKLEKTWKREKSNDAYETTANSQMKSHHQSSGADSNKDNNNGLTRNCVDEDH